LADDFTTLSLTTPVIYRVLGSMKKLKCLSQLTTIVDELTRLAGVLLIAKCGRNLKMAEVNLQEAMESLWQLTQSKQRWNRDLIQAVKAGDVGQVLKDHFTHTNPVGFDWVLYNWFISTAFGIGINHIKKL
jgi:hypothetical protein